MLSMKVDQRENEHRSLTLRPIQRLFLYLELKRVQLELNSGKIEDFLY